MLPCCDKSGDVRHVDHKIRPDRVRDLAHALKIYEPRVRARPGDDELRAALLGALPDLIVIDSLGLGVDAIEAGVEVFPGNGRLGAVGQVTAVAQIHAEDGITRLEESEIHRNIRLRAGVRLDIRMLRAEELHCPVARKVLDLVDILAAAVVSRAGIALSIFICEMAAHGLHHGGRNKVLRCDKLYMVSLALELAHHRIVDRGILLPYVIVHGFASVFCFPNDFTPLCCP